MLLLLFGLCGILPSVQAQTPYYHIERSYSAVDCYIAGTPTVADLYAEAEELTETVAGTIKLNTNGPPDGTYAIEKQMAITVCYNFPEDAWNAVVNYNGTPSNYPGKIFDNAGWVRGTKLAHGEWGGYIWLLQNTVNFTTSSNNVWVSTNGVTNAISKVLVGTIGDYAPMQTVEDTGPTLIATNFPGANQGHVREYKVDISNIFYKLSIPDIWITPRFAKTSAGGSNVQYTVAGANIPTGVTWAIIPVLTNGAGIQSTGDWHYASASPGNVATNYKVRATSVDNTNFWDEVNLAVYKVDIVESNVYIAVTNTVTLHLTTNSSSDVTWEIKPTVQNGASIEGSSSGTSVVINSGSVPTNYTVRAYATEFTNCYDICTATVFKIEKIPLGGSTNLSKYIMGKVYIPTKWGGSNALSGANVELFYTDGSNLTADTVSKIYNGELDGNRVAQGNPCQYDVPTSQHGWYYVKIGNDTPTSISSAFTQSACSSNRPWNFYWWAKKGDYIREPETGTNGIADSQKAPESDDVQVIGLSNTVASGGDIIRCGDDGILQSTNTPNDEKCVMVNLFDAGGALEKYDTVYSETAKAWELANDQGNEGWHGHCLGASMASILLNQPSPTNTSSLTIDELEGLWAELGEKNDIYTYSESSFTGCPAGPPTAGADGTDTYVGKLHGMLEQYIKGEAAALQSNLRAYGGGSSTQVWNHAVWKYEAGYEEAPGGNEKIVKITNNLTANDDHEPPTNDESNRDITYLYIVEYKNDGTVDVDAASKDWISVSGSASFALKNLIRVTGANWGGNNPHVTESNVRALDESN